MADPAVPVQILALYTFVGPNVGSPQPGVLMQAQGTADYTTQLRGALKDAAQFVGMILAHLTVQAQPLPTSNSTGGWLIEARFNTPQPELGRDLVRYVVAGLGATLADDEEWDRDTPLFALQQRRRREQLPLPLLQLIAEARQRQVPTTLLPNGRVLFGYGRQSWQIERTAYARLEDDEDGSEMAPPPAPDWQMLAAVPLYVVTGAARAVLAAQIAQTLQALGTIVALHPDADLSAIYTALADPTAEAIVLGIGTDLILSHGVPFATCRVAVVTELAASDSAQPLRLRACYLPVLLASDAAFAAQVPAEVQQLAGGVLSPLDALPAYLAH